MSTINDVHAPASENSILVSVAGQVASPVTSVYNKSASCICSSFCACCEYNVACYPNTLLVQYTYSNSTVPTSAVNSSNEECIYNDALLTRADCVS